MSTLSGPGRRTTWVLSFLALGLYIVGAVVAGTGGGPFDAQAVFGLVTVASFATVAVLIASSRERNRLGWVYLGVALSVGISATAAGVATFDLAHPPVGVIGTAGAVYASSGWVGWVLIPATFLLLLFPDGRLPSPRWRYVAWCAAASVVGGVLIGVLHPGPTEDFPQVDNPLGVPQMTWVEPVMLLLAVVAVLACAASLVVRFRGSSGLQLQQIKWVAYAGAVASPTFVVALALYDRIGEDVANGIIQLTILGVPVAAGIAILRYRLYDIDIVINRTLVYATLTAFLVGAYLGTVLLLQFLLQAVTAGSDLAVAGSTLAVAGLFRPLRARIQRGVDRRFYRNRYDAARTLVDFSATLRHQLDPDALADDICHVVQRTVQPSHAWLWTPHAPAERS